MIRTYDFAGYHARGARAHPRQARFQWMFDDPMAFYALWPDTRSRYPPSDRSRRMAESRRPWAIFHVTQYQVLRRNSTRFGHLARTGRGADQGGRREELGPFASGHLQDGSRVVPSF